jgi:hypothetical protein
LTYVEEHLANSAPKPLAEILIDRCYDYQRDSLLYLIHQIEASNAYHPTISLCLALFLSESNQVNDFIISAMSRIISEGKHYYIVLENDQTRSVMEFEHNTNLTLRNLIKNEGTFVKIVEKIVEMNRSEGGPGQEINVLLLDKINKHKEVITEMARLQRIEIEGKIPNYF